MLYFRNDDLLLFVSHRWVKHEMRVERVTIRPYVSKKKKTYFSTHEHWICTSSQFE